MLASGAAHRMLTERDAPPGESSGELFRVAKTLHKSKGELNAID